MVNPFGRDPRDIGKRIEQLRLALAMTQTQFGSEIGKRQSDVAGWETGARPPGLKIGHQICDAFQAYDVTLDYIYRGDMSHLTERIRVAIARIRRAA